MGQYVSQPQTNRYALGDAFLQKYKYNFSPDEQITTTEVLNTLHDALEYQQLRKQLYKILNEADNESLRSQVENLLYKTQQPEIISATNPTVPELESSLKQLREAFIQNEASLPELKDRYQRIKARLIATERSLKILESDNQELLTNRDNFIKLMKLSQIENLQNAAKLKEQQVLIQQLQKDLRVTKREQDNPAQIISGLEKKVLELQQMLSVLQIDFELVETEFNLESDLIEQLAHELNTFSH